MIFGFFHMNGAGMFSTVNNMILSSGAPIPNAPAPVPAPTPVTPILDASKSRSLPPIDQTNYCRIGQKCFGW